VDETEAVIEAAGGVKRWRSGFSTGNPQESTCVLQGPAKAAAQQKTQSVLVLKRNDPSALLKGHESFENLLHAR